MGSLVSLQEPEETGFEVRLWSVLPTASLSVLKPEYDCTAEENVQQAATVLTLSEHLFTPQSVESRSAGRAAHFRSNVGDENEGYSFKSQLDSGVVWRCLFSCGLLMLPIISNIFAYSWTWLEPVDTTCRCETLGSIMDPPSHRNKPCCLVF